MSDEPNRFLIIAGEASGDLHGGGLVRSLKKLHPGCEFSGLGGDHMREERVKTFLILTVWERLVLSSCWVICLIM